MIVIIAGSRTICSYPKLLRAIAEFQAQHGAITMVVSGCAPGPDSLGIRWASENNIPLKKFPANWRPNGIYNARAGLERNQDMANFADALLLLWDGKSRGSAHMLSCMNHLGKPVHVTTS